MAEIGVMVFEKHGTRVLNRYACANPHVAERLVQAIRPPSDPHTTDPIWYDYEAWEFTDAEYPDTIGYFNTLTADQIRERMHILYGQPVVRTN